ncbi:hypothetical protein [Clostridium botulinum]|uniref:hypothetical protein n=1 Tax=Clostridium botulinum TaxID=1491 RepID=UPI0004DA9B14|nr:hypothetical protein [Clostridium botulinum]KEH99788.1 hypothetical protein Z952_p0115 [Clostridium botulinum C/D str. BKT75002]KEI05266.1 hypothetical protein Z954_0116 [Clostridium botulinum C/D str. BKT2873]QPW61956.1 hypothetical protein IG390_13960 [Clostridium botulinum]
MNVVEEQQLNKDLKKVKEKFIKALVRTLNEENENRVYDGKKPLGVCFMVSIIDKQLHKYKDFLRDLSNGYTFNGYEEDESGYSNGKISLFIEKHIEDKESNLWASTYKQDYWYSIEFKYDTRDWGYCQCEPNDKGYNEEHDCCGKTCDWDAPSFAITKEYDLGTCSWDGFQRDYWEYEKMFKSKEENKNKRVEDEIKERRKQEIMEQINLLNQELISLES